MSKKIKSDIMLLITALIWGSAFVAQKAGTAVGPFTYCGLRQMIGCVALLPVIFIFDRINAKKGSNEVELSAEEKAEQKKTLIIGGICCGIALTFAGTVQQFGLYFDTDAGKAGFITSLYIVMVPILGLFIKKKVRPIIWLCVALGALGFYMLTMAGSGSGFYLEKGDFFVLLCAFLFACHILVVDHFAPKCDGIRLSWLQFFVAGILNLICMFIFEKPVLADILDVWFPIFYAGVFSSGIAYTLQVVAQKDAEPAVASLIMSLESVFSVLFGVLLLHETMTLVQGLGCVVIFIAVIIPQLPTKEERLQMQKNK